MSQAPPQHESGTAESERALPEPSYAEQAKTLMHRGRIGSLSTLSQKHPGWPFGSLMPYGLDHRGSPIFLISTLAMHTRNLLGDDRASLMVSQPGPTGDPLGAARVTVMGQGQKLTQEASDQVREQYLTRFANAAHWIDFPDFGFYQLEIMDVYYVGGFGAMGWIPAEDYHQASIDPLADETHTLIDKLHHTYASHLKQIAQQAGYPNVQSVVVTSLDYLGFHLRFQTEDRVQSLRIAFPQPATTATMVHDFVTRPESLKRM